MMRASCKIWKALPAVLLAAALLASCGKPESAPDPISLGIKMESSDASGSSQFVTVTASGEWTLSVSDASGKAVEWAWLSGFGGEEQDASVSGKGPATVVFHWSVNPDTGNRVCKLTLKSGSQTADVTFIQEGATVTPVNPTLLKDDPVGKWMEMPAFTAGQGKYFISHEMKVNGRYCRNFEYCWDPDNLVATWVAYPLNKELIDGSTGRSDQWGLDPKVPRRYQPCLINRSYRNFDNPDSWSGYDRGHQLPSADRYNKSDAFAANIMTFYGTNMTPQSHDLNTGSWSKLEDKVRTWCSQFDTLYVVTGCSVQGSTVKVKDDDLKHITVPSGYFKALLGYAGASSAKQAAFRSYESSGYYLGIAFWFDNKGGGDINKNSMTIDQLEARTGIDFFVNLPTDVESKVESKVESWWSKN